ncbi:MAG: xylulokinase [Alphaproteobacteria bacterium]
MFLGIDLGTSSLKLLLIDENQQLIASKSAVIHASDAPAGWSMQDPKSWIAALENAMGYLREDYAAQIAKIQAIGLSGQMHGACLLDAADQLLYPAILWNDGRAALQASALSKDQAFLDQTGNLVFAGFTAPKLLWMQQNRPDIFDKVAKILLPKDYLRHYLTGEYISDMSDASGTSWLNVGSRDWSDELLDKTGLTRSQMPALVEGSDEGGRLRPSLARKWGIDAAPMIAGGAGDNAASAVGIGVINENQGFISLGTSGVVFRATADFKPNPDQAVHSFCHALPLLWHQMGVMLSAGQSLEWFAAQHNIRPDQLVAELSPDQLQAVGGEYFLPYLSGERTPHNDPHLRAGFYGISATTTRRDLTKAILMGVGFGLYDNLLALSAVNKTPLDRLLLVGGGASVKAWAQIIADILQIELAIPDDCSHAASLGAARLAMLATKKFTQADVLIPPSVTNSIRPNKALAQPYRAAHHKHTKLYKTLSALY